MTSEKEIIAGILRADARNPENQSDTETPKPFNLRARIAELMTTAQDEMLGGQAESLRIFGLTELSHYPVRLTQLRNQIQQLTEICAELLKPYASAVNEIRADIWGDKAYSNEDKRKAELEARLADWIEYQRDLNEQAAFAVVIQRLKIELESTLDEFSAAKLYFRLQIAETLAASGKDAD